MEQDTKHVLKNGDVELQGRFQLDLAQTDSPHASATNARTTQPKVSITQNNPDFAVIEITCSCGTKTQVKCQYANGESNDPKTNKQ